MTEKEEQRIEGFDLLRIISAIAVAGSHTLYTAYAPLWILKHLSFAVPCFVMMAIYLSLRYINQNELSLQYFLRSRAGRLIYPFLSWTFVYLIIRWIIGSINFPTFYNCLEYIFLGSAAMHLYFIPMIFYYSVILMIIYKSGSFQLLICIIGLSVAIFFQCKEIPSIHIGMPESNVFPYYFIHNLPYLFISILLFIMIEQTIILKKISQYGNIIAFIFCATTIIIWVIPYITSLVIPTHSIILNSFLFLTFRFLSINIPEWINSVSIVSFGIYLSHHLIFEGLARLRLQIGFILTTTGSVLVYFTIGIMLITGFCIFLEKVKYTRWLVT